jgi:hypothetical protein
VLLPNTGEETTEGCGRIDQGSNHRFVPQARRRYSHEVPGRSEQFGIRYWMQHEHGPVVQIDAKPRPGIFSLYILW